MDELWHSFALSGSVEDYIKYKNKGLVDTEDADDCKRNNNQGTDDGGE